MQTGASFEQQAQQMGQKYLGARPEGRIDAMFNTKAPKADGVHPVPVSNFMNAQCKQKQPAPLLPALQ